MQTQKYTLTDAYIQWAYLFEEHKPLQTNRCALFWRCSVLTPIRVVLVGAAVVVIAGMITTVMLGVFGSITGIWIGWAKPVAPMTDAGRQVFKWAWIVAASVVAVGVFGHYTGLWDWLHKYCIPVEIQGGLVKKGSCPACASRLVLKDGGEWGCVKCKGYFVPPTEKSPADDAENQPTSV